jgi:DNA-binding transcriptional LysR family regulator
MVPTVRDLDWTLLQSFVSVAEHGSLSAASKSKGASQPTMSRHISALEAALGVMLFDRTGDGLVLTPTGLALLDEAREMSAAAGRLVLAATGRAEAIDGTIRVTASEVVSAYMLPPILARLGVIEPGIQIELVSSDRTENLLEREADIALRMFRPAQAELVARKVGDVAFGIFASKDYVARAGAPQSISDLRAHRFIGHDRNMQSIEGFRGAGLNIDRSFFAFRTDDAIVQWRMVLAGFGIGFTLRDIGLAEDTVVQLLPQVAMPRPPLWLTAHAELKTSRRVRRVYDFLADALETEYGRA